MDRSNPPVPGMGSRAVLLAFLLVNLAYGLLAMTACLPSMTQWTGEFGRSQAAVQLVFSAYVLAYGCLQLLYGPLSDRLGRRPLLLAGLVLCTLGAAGAAMADSLESLIAARVVQGAGCAAGMVVGRAMVQDLFSGAQRTRSMAYIGMTLGLCPPLATLVGGQVHVRWGWQANFVWLAVLALVLLLWGWRTLPRPAPTQRQPGDASWLGAMLGAYRLLLARSDFVLMVFQLGMTTATFYVFLGGSPLVLQGFGVQPQEIGFYVMCVPGTYILGNFLSSHWARRLGDQGLMLAGQTLTMIGVALIWILALTVGGTWALVVPLMLVGLGHGLLVPPTMATTVGLVPALAGAAAAVAGLLQQLMGALGGYTVGLFRHDGAVQLGALMLGYATLGAVAQGVLVLRERRRHLGGTPR